MLKRKTHICLFHFHFFLHSITSSFECFQWNFLFFLCFLDNTSSKTLNYIIRDYLLLDDDVHSLWINCFFFDQNFVRLLFFFYTLIFSHKLDKNKLKNIVINSSFFILLAFLLSFFFNLIDFEQCDSKLLKQMTICKRN